MSENMLQEETMNPSEISPIEIGPSENNLAKTNTNDHMPGEIMIQCENLVKIYKTKDLEVMALQGLDLTVERGELMAVIGNSGSGKSTFLNMVGGLDKPSAGKLMVDGRDLFSLKEKELQDYKQNCVGFVWQNNARNLFPYLTALQNIELPMGFVNKKKRNLRKDNASEHITISDHDYAMELLELVGLGHKKNAKLSQLSGGEQQRIAIAIALANRPKLLLADEPTGAVDTKTSAYILDVFRELNKEKNLTICIVTHDRNLAKKVNRVVRICDGKVSSEDILKISYKERLSQIDDLSNTVSTHETYAVLDRAGRLQLSKDDLAAIGVTDHKVRVKVEDGRIIITP